MPRRPSVAVATIALVLSAGSASAQRASLAIGASSAIGDFASLAGSGLDIQLQARTEPIIGGLPLRIDIGYDRLAGKGVVSSYTISAQSVSLLVDFSKRFYGAVGPGYYQVTSRTTLDGKTGNSQRQYGGAQLALGMNIPVFRWEGFLEVSAVKLFQPGPTRMWVPARFGIRL